MIARKPGLPVAVLGATGLVGQRLVALLDGHPMFELAQVAASDRSAGRPYARAATWRLPVPVPERAASLEVLPCDPARIDAPVVLSALDASVAREIEAAFAAAGRIVVSNARSWRREPDVPLVVPEVNADHLALIERQREARGWSGAIVTNPNCSVIGLVLALAPLHAEAGVRRVVATTLQAASGAGYPGVPALDLLDNVVPAIPGEEDKLQAEPPKILGTLAGSGVTPAPVTISAHTHRVPVQDGHLIAVSVETGRALAPERAAELMRAYRGEPQRLGLPTAPEAPIRVVEADDRPQPRLDREAGGGMAVTVGRIARCPVLGLRFELLAHNTLRGAAGGTLLLAELLAARGSLP
ncbi:MAG: aspartate-semialdehyde dehydrogenase [Acidobacteriota bacterium]